LKIIRQRFFHELMFTEGAGCAEAAPVDLLMKNPKTLRSAKEMAQPRVTPTRSAMACFK
jgi:hypothetical protein